MKSYFVHNGTVALHVLENGVPEPGRPSLLIIGGLWEPAERAIPLLSALDGHAVAFSLRGRGLSSTPASGYDLDGHLSDIQTVVEHCGLVKYAVLGFSRGGAYALGWTLRDQKNMRGLLLVDQPPIHRRVTEQAVEFWSELVYREVPILNFMRRDALEGLKREAAEVEFSSRLTELQLPVTVFAGTSGEAAIPSDISVETRDKYGQSLSRVQFVDFAQSGHMIPDEEPAKYAREVERFVQGLN
ncbi:alpha/beta fold hydrolase [Gorillibacterium sp. sgz500922]|uniref:alpha/beta fold hydrolase n=1 Tax=Gorillibacterium sp. sgz500922 TaxID=3446694 RepID=UPI003F680CAA